MVKMRFRKIFRLTAEKGEVTIIGSSGMKINLLRSINLLETPQY